MGWRKKLLFSAVATILFFGLLEVILLVAGVRPIFYDEDPYVGFSSAVPLFERTTTEDGTDRLVVAKNKRPFFNADQQFSDPKPDGTFRVFCLGGSTTFGRPYSDKTSYSAWLRALLPKVEKDRDWEVINVGGISYASYRLAMLAEEVSQYEPDLFVIYTGHNEFLEERTYRDLKETPVIVKWISSLARKTRTFALVRRIMNKFQSTADDENNTNEQRTDLPDDVRTRLDNTIGPTDYTRDDELKAQIIEHFQLNLNRMIAIGRSCGARVILIRPASNVREFSPFKSDFHKKTNSAQRRRFVELVTRAQTYHDQGQSSEALEMVRAALQIDDRYAQGYFLEGQILDALRQYEDAMIAYERARDEDICPLRAVTEIEQIVSEVASQNDVALVDFSAMAREKSDNEIPGNNLFYDHVHPTIEGHRDLALAILRAMRQADILSDSGEVSDATIEKVSRTIIDGIDKKRHGSAQRNLAKVLEWSGKFREAEQAATRAVKLAPDDWEAHRLLGTCAKSLGHFDQAIEHYRHSIEYAPDFAPTHVNLAEVLLHTGAYQRAIEHCRQALALYNAHPSLVASGRATAELHTVFGSALAHQGKKKQAKQQFLIAIQKDPDFAAAHSKLGPLYLKLDKDDLARRHLLKAAKLEPNNANYQFNFAEVLHELKDYDQARAYYDRTAGLNADLLFNKAATIWMEDPTRSHAMKVAMMLRAVLGQRPNMQGAQTLLAEVLGRLGQTRAPRE